MILTLIAAMSENRVIGIENRLPWDLPSDLKRFRTITKGHPVIMGRKTHESIGRLLPERENIVITRNPAYQAIPGAIIAPSLQEAIGKLRDRGTLTEAFVIGGAEIYSQALTQADRLQLTIIHREYDGDAHFPRFENSGFVETSREDHMEPLPHSFVTYERTNP